MNTDCGIYYKGSDSETVVKCNSNINRSFGSFHRFNGNLKSAFLLNY